MGSKYINRILSLTLTVLVVLLILSYLLRNQHQKFESNFPRIDSLKVTGIHIHLKTNPAEGIVLTRKNSNWELLIEMNPNKRFVEIAEISKVESLLGELSKIKLERLVSRDKKSWERYEVGDSSSSRIKIEQDDKILTELIIGKFSMKQGQQQNGQQQMSGTTYVRVSGSDEVFAVEGFLGPIINQPVSSYRNQTFLRAKTEAITKLTFDYGNDSSFSLIKSGEIWKTGNSIANPEKVRQYLQSLAYRNLPSFENDFHPSGPPEITLTIESEGLQSIALSAWAKSNGEYLMNSSLNSPAYFNSKKDGPYSQFFKGKNYFLK